MLLRVSTQLTKLAETYKDSTVAEENVTSARERLEDAFQMTRTKGKGKGKDANPQQHY